MNMELGRRNWEEECCFKKSRREGVRLRRNWVKECCFKKKRGEGVRLRRRSEYGTGARKAKTECTMRDEEVQRTRKGRKKITRSFIYSWLWHARRHFGQAD